jgi:aconitate decarboxylase
MNHVDLVLAHLAAHRDPASVPASAHTAARTWMLDSLGVALAGTAVAQSAPLIASVANWGSAAAQDGARIWGAGQILPAPHAALINAFHIHNQEFDCVHERAVVHPTAVILATLLAYGERSSARGAPVAGPRFTAALALAVDVAAVIGMSATQPLRFFRPAQCGALGAVAGLIALENLPDATARDAFGLVYSQLAGTMQAHIEGTPTLALQVGFAARSALCALDLAIANIRAPRDVLDGPHGYFSLFEPDANPAPAFAELGQRWQIEHVSHKPYPTGRAAQGGIAGFIALREQHGFSAADVTRITLHAPPLIRQLVDRPMRSDMTVNYARLCLPFLLATTLKRGTVTLDAYRPGALADSALPPLAAKVRIEPDANTNVNALTPQRLTVTLASGLMHSLDLPHVYGAPEAPMSANAQQEKFTACCRHAARPLNDARIAALAERVAALATVSDVSELVSLTLPS